jgi:hypothetical protein
MPIFTDVEDSFRSMSDEWKSLRAAPPAKPDATRQWEYTVAAMRAEQAALQERGEWLSGPVDLLSIIHRARREVDHCAVLAWLLDPGAPHGLGAMFLTRLLERCFPSDAFDAPDLAHAQTRCEVRRERSRADIVVSARSLMLLIEAKVDHVERPSQCDDLHSDFATEHGARFVFLSPDGREAGTATECMGIEFHPLSFLTVRELLRDIVQELGPTLRARPGFPALATYLQTLESEFT